MGSCCYPKGDEGMPKFVELQGPQTCSFEGWSPPGSTEASTAEAAALGPGKHESIRSWGDVLGKVMLELRDNRSGKWNPAPRLLCFGCSERKSTINLD